MIGYVSTNSVIATTRISTDHV